MSSVVPSPRAQAQTYGGNTVDCYISGITAPSPMQSGGDNNIVAHGGNHGTVAGNCHITGSIHRTNGGYDRDFREVDITVGKNGTFEVHYTDSAPKPGQYTIQVCARATGPDATHPADDCKTITRNAVEPSGGGGDVDCYIGSITAPSPLHSGQKNNIVAKGGNHGTANGNCRVTGNIKRTGGGYDRNFRTLTVSVAKNGTFEVHYTDDVKQTGQYKIQVCAAATSNGTHPADDCKTITRNAV